MGKFYRVLPASILRELMHPAPAAYARAKEYWDNQLWNYYTEKPAPPLVLHDYNMIVSPATVIGDKENVIDGGVALVNACHVLRGILKDGKILGAFLPPLGHLGRGNMPLGVCVAILSYYLDDRFTLLHLPTEEMPHDFRSRPC